MAYTFDDNWTRNQVLTDCYAGAPVANSQLGATHRPRRGARRGFPIHQVGLFVLTIVMLKIFLLLDLGGAAYGAKLAALSEGNLMERIAGGAMTMDPFTSWVAQGIRFGAW